MSIDDISKHFKPLKEEDSPYYEKVLSDGYDSLSPKQREVHDAYVNGKISTLLRPEIIEKVDEEMKIVRQNFRAAQARSEINASEFYIPCSPRLQ